MWMDLSRPHRAGWTRLRAIGRAFLLADATLPDACLHSRRTGLKVAVALFWCRVPMLIFAAASTTCAWFNERILALPPPAAAAPRTGGRRRSRRWRSQWWWRTERSCGWGRRNADLENDLLGVVPLPHQVLADKGQWGGVWIGCVLCRADLIDVISNSPRAAC